MFRLLRRMYLPIHFISAHFDKQIRLISLPFYTSMTCPHDYYKIPAILLCNVSIVLLINKLVIKNFQEMSLQEKRNWEVATNFIFVT